VLPFADILALASPLQQQAPPPPRGIGPQERSYDVKAAPPPPGEKSPIEDMPLGVSFLDVAKEAGLTSKTIYGGEAKNKYLLETTGCGLAF
jgi:enediyne biosynthesis protein E4